MPESEIEKQVDKGIQRCGKEAWELIGKICEDDPRLWRFVCYDLMLTLRAVTSESTKEEQCNNSKSP